MNSPTTGRPALLRVCELEPTRLTEDEIDLVALVNAGSANQIEFFDRALDPDDYLLPVVALEHLVTHYDIKRHAKGDRVINVQSSYRRYLLPFLIERTIAGPVDQRGASWYRVGDAEAFARMHAGDQPLPAATVAGDILGRVGVGCIWLAPDEAAQVVHGGVEALNAAHESGHRTPPVPDPGECSGPEEPQRPRAADRCASAAAVGATRCSSG